MRETNWGPTNGEVVNVTWGPDGLKMSDGEKKEFIDEVINRHVEKQNRPLEELLQEELDILAQAVYDVRKMVQVNINEFADLPRNEMMIRMDVHRVLDNAYMRCNIANKRVQKHK